MLKTAIASCASVLLAFGSMAQSHPPIEAYGERPEIDHVALSASGEKVVLAVRSKENMTATVVREDYVPPKFRRAIKKIDLSGLTYYPTKFVVHDLKSRTTQSLLFDDYGEIIGVDFIGDKHVIITQRLSTVVVNRMSQFLHASHSFNAMVWNLEENQIKQFVFEEDLDDAPEERRRLRVLGVVAKAAEENMVYVQALASEKSFSRAHVHLLKADLDTGSVSIVNKGNEDTIDWMVRSDGQLLAREDYDNRFNKYKIVSERDGTKKEVFKLNGTKRPPFSLMGVHPNGTTLIIQDTNQFDYLAELTADGQIVGPLLQRAGKDIDYVFVDENHIVEGVRFSGVVPSYQFFDPELNKDVQAFLTEIPSTGVTIVDRSANWEKVLLKLEGGFTSGMFVLYDRASRSRELISELRPEITQDAIGETLAFEYLARDGLTIEAIVTLPPNIDLNTVAGLKTIVMPHGGPETYDSIGFDWMAQYFANRGYLVLQPNFRGSAGYGADFVAAGNGEWGGKMQDDLTDGLKSLVESGLTDPEKVCIVGASYGGYAALAGGAFTPDLYACVVAIAPVSDLNRMLKDEKRDYGRSHWVIDYWEERMSDGVPRSRKLKSISPANHASNFEAPVLLIHGYEDSVVPIKQSEIMRDALTRAGKRVEFIDMKEADHWLSDSPARLAALEATSAFVEEHLR